MRHTTTNRELSTRTASVADVSASAMHGKSLIVSRREKPDFSAMTAGKMMFGVLGAAAMISAGNKIVADNQIEDPAVDVGRAEAVVISSSRPATIKVVG